MAVPTEFNQMGGEVVRLINDTLRAAKVLVPAYRFPDDLFPEGYALIDVWSGVETTTASIFFCSCSIFR